MQNFTIQKQPNHESLDLPCLHFVSRMASQAKTLTFHVNTSTGSKRSDESKATKGYGKYCPICKSSGKSVEEYTSHFVRESRDPDSRVVCPVLLASECRYCGKKGHMKSHCHLLKRRNEKRNSDRTISRAYQPDKTKKTFQDVATFHVAANRKGNSSRKFREWQKKHSSSIVSDVKTVSDKSRFAVLDCDFDGETDEVLQSQRMPSIGSKPLPSPLPYGKMMKRVSEAKPVAVAVPEAKPVAVVVQKPHAKTIKKAVTFSKRDEIVEEVKDSFNDDFNDDFNDSPIVDKKETETATTNGSSLFKDFLADVADSWCDEVDDEW